MAVHDPIADMLTIIRNGSIAGLSAVTVKASRVKMGILQILKEESFIYDFKRVDDTRQGVIKIYLKVPETKEDARIRGIRKIHRSSSPGLRRYTTNNDMPHVLGGLGACVVSTSKGIMTGTKARKLGIGGEVLLKVW